MVIPGQTPRIKELVELTKSMSQSTRNETMAYTSPITSTSEEDANAIIQASVHKAQTDHAKLHGLGKPWLLGHFFMLDENGNFVKP